MHCSFTVRTRQQPPAAGWLSLLPVWQLLAPANHIRLDFSSNIECVGASINRYYERCGKHSLIHMPIPRCSSAQMRIAGSGITRNVWWANVLDWTYFKSPTGRLHGDREGGTKKANGEASVKKEPKKSPSTPLWHLISKARDMMTPDTTTEAEKEVEGKSSVKMPGFPRNILKSGREKK